MTTKKIVPSLPAQSFDELEGLFAALNGIASEIQVDIVDGQFVPHVSWPFTEADVPKELHRLGEYTKDFDLEIDCMVMHPEQYLDLLMDIGAKRVIVHMRSTDAYEEIMRHAELHGYVLGLAFTNDVPIKEITPYLDRVHFVQVMGIAHVGQQGQPFDERTLVTVQTLKEQYPSLEVSVDGSVNKETIPKLLEAGVDRFAPGSAVAKADDQKAAFKELQKLIS